MRPGTASGGRVYTGTRGDAAIHSRASAVYRRLYGADLPLNTPDARLNHFALIHSTPVGMWRALASGYVYAPPSTAKEPELSCAMIAYKDEPAARWRGMQR